MYSNYHFVPWVSLGPRCAVCLHLLIGSSLPSLLLLVDTQVFVANYASELGLSPVAGRSPAHFADSEELGDVVCWSDNVDHCIAYLNKVRCNLGQGGWINVRI